MWLKRKQTGNLGPLVNGVIFRDLEFAICTMKGLVVGIANFPVRSLTLQLKAFKVGLYSRVSHTVD